jgi:poly [ADP-ribose] polymerase
MKFVIIFSYKNRSVLIKLIMKSKASKAKKQVQDKKEVKKTKTTKQVAKAKDSKKSAVKVSSKVVTTTVTTKTNGKTSKKVTKKVVKTVTTPNTPTKTVNSSTSDTKIVKAISKNNAVVDSKFPNNQNYYVVSDYKGDYNNVAFDCTMNQSDLKNNNNKFYIIQMISPENNPKQYIVWNRWGRVGYDGQTASFPFNDYNQAKDAFLKKYKDKTKNGYTALVMDYSNNNVDTSVKTAKKVKKVIKESKLPTSIQNLMNLIYDTQIMNKQMAEIGYDAKKMPLGKLGKETITAGYKVLKNIENVLKKKEKGDLKDLSSEFYTLIPHDFGFR